MQISKCHFKSRFPFLCSDFISRFEELLLLFHCCGIGVRWFLIHLVVQSPATKTAIYHHLIPPILSRVVVEANMLVALKRLLDGHLDTSYEQVDT